MPNLFSPQAKKGYRWVAILSLGVLFACEKKDTPSDTVAPARVAQHRSGGSGWFVSVDEARKAAEHIALSLEVEAQRQHNKTESDTQRVFAGLQPLRSLTPIIGQDGKPLVYVANYEYGGWSLIAADAHMQPLLAFSENGHFGVEQFLADGTLAATVARNKEAPTLPEGVLDWLQTTDDIVAALRENPDEKNADPAAEAGWKLIGSQPCPITMLPRGGGSGQGWSVPCPPVDGDTGGGQPCTTTQRGPLLRTAWGQGCGYNDFTPSGTGQGYCGHCPTGCVATAMAQVINFHRYPNNRNWAAMPPGGFPIATGASHELAVLMRDCGAAVLMSYNNTESGAIDRLVAPALKGGTFWILGTLYSTSTIFHYGSADYVNGSGINTDIENDVGSGRPSIVGGDSNTGGHMWVCDGYIWATCTFTSVFNGQYITIRQGSHMFHMDWGWSGLGTGWFTSGDWQVTVGNTVRNYQYNHCAIVNIHP